MTDRWRHFTERVAPQRFNQRYARTPMQAEFSAEESIDNILFDLPYVEERYQKTLEVRLALTCDVIG